MASETVHRTCPLCEAHCGIAVEVDRRARRVLGVRGDPADPFSQGYLCPKAHGLKGLQEDPDRLRRPLRRRGRDWEEIGWEEALDLAAGRLREIRAAHGPEAVGSYVGNPNAHDLGSVFYLPALLRGLGTRQRFSASSVDQLPKMLSSVCLYGGGLTIPVPDVDRTDYLLMLGANPLASNGSLLTAPDLPGRLRKLRERGGKLVVVDPRRSETARLADEHHFIRPGADAFFLFSLVHTLFEERLARLGAAEGHVQGVEELRALARDFPPEATAAVTGIEAATVRRLARELAAAPTAACYGRIGTCTQEFGTLASWLVDCVTLLTGNLDRPGGALFPRSAVGPAPEVPRRPAKLPYARWRSSRRGLPEAFGELPAACLAEEIEGGAGSRIRALLTVAGNPVLSTPNGARLSRALESLEFMASVDIYLNETTRFADVILPPPAPLERSNCEVVFLGLSVRHTVHFSPAALPRPDGQPDQWQILAELAGRMNGADADTVDDLVLSSLLGSTVGPGTGCPNVTQEQARERLGKERGPERILDLLLRAGPWGDRFEPGREGLSLAELRKHPHGLDLGPLEPRLSEVLATPSGQIELAHELLASDVPRLREALRRQRNGEMVLVGRRQVRNNNSWMGNVESLAKGRDRCTLLVHPDDAERLGLANGGSARVRSRAGEITAPVAVSDEIMPGVVSLPHGFGHGAPGARLGVAARHAGVNSNLLTDEAALDELSGNAVLNGIPVDISAVG
jgi:anaerobic selenocysteine-containing dehydrogenase